MQKITEQQILAMAPNAAAAANGLKIAKKGGFIRLECSADDTFYLGECSGSGKSNYITSADFIDPAAPLIRCSCPSRQFPCKHGLALLYVIMQGENFASCEIPEDIKKKRAKKQVQNEKKQKEAEGRSGDTIPGKSGKTAASQKAARTKKCKKQLEGLNLASKMVQDLMDAGLGTMGGTAVDSYRQLAKQLGDYYLPGPQQLLNRLILEITEFQKDGNEIHYENVVDVLERMWVLLKKARVYLEEKLERGDTGFDDSPLYEELGGVFKLSELEAMGCYKDHVRLTQLAFFVTYDEVRREYTDTGCWADIDSAEVSMTYNYRPLKALKYVKQEDTVFGTAQIERAFYYPGEGNKRVRWERAEILPIAKEDINRLRANGQTNLAKEAKAAKNILKNTLADPLLYRLLSFKRISRTAQGPVLEDREGNTILLGNPPNMEAAAERVFLLPDGSLLKDQVLLGGFFYDKRKRRLLFWPLSILTADQIVRLMY